jgi:hypothetical protein
MAYNSASLRRFVNGNIDDSLAGNLWMYTSADAVATVVAQDYITNPVDMGMAVNDLVIIIDTATPLISIARVKTVSSVSTTGALLSTGVTIGNT